nr:hypothetical protein [Crucivirus sp.]
MNNTGVIKFACEFYFYIFTNHVFYCNLSKKIKTRLKISFIYKNMEQKQTQPIPIPLKEPVKEDVVPDHLRKYEECDQEELCLDIKQCLDSIIKEVPDTSPTLRSWLSDLSIMLDLLFQDLEEEADQEEDIPKQQQQPQIVLQSPSYYSPQPQHRYPQYRPQYRQRYY